MQEEKVIKTFYIRKDQYEKLKELSDKTGAPMAELLRRALDAYFQKNLMQLKHLV